MLTFDETALRGHLARMSSPARLAFAVMCAQRLAPLAAEIVHRAGGPSQEVQRALEHAWSAVLAPPDRGATEQLLETIMRLIPDEDAPGWTPSRPYLEDALSALAYCLRCLLSGEAQEAVWAAQKGYDALDYYLHDREHGGEGAVGIDPVVEARVLADPLMQTELARQQRDVNDLLQADPAMFPHIVGQLRCRSEEERILPPLWR
jgi:hypothetical protein